MTKIKFLAQTEQEYETSDGNRHKIEYECEYSTKVPQIVPDSPLIWLVEVTGGTIDPRKITISCEFKNIYPLWGHEKIYGTGGFEQSKGLILEQWSYDIFSEIHTVIHTGFRFNTERPSSYDEKNLQIFHKKLQKEIEEFMPAIIGDGYCITQEEVLELDAKDRKHAW